MSTIPNSPSLRPAGGKGEDLPNLPGFDVVNALPRMAGNKNLYRKVLTQYHDRYGAADQEIRTLMQAGSLDEAKRLVHTIKGVAGNVGANDVYQVSAELEAALTTESWEEKLALFAEKLHASIKILSDALINPPAKSAEAFPHLEKITSLLRESNPDAYLFYEEIKDAMQKAIPAIFPQFDTALSEFNYDEALKILKNTPLS